MDSEEVVEHRHYEVVVQVPPTGPADDETDDRQTFGVRVTEDLDRRIGTPTRDGPTQEVVLPRSDHIDAHLILQVEDQPGADGLDDRGRTTFLPVLGIAHVDVFLGVDVRDRASADRLGNGVADVLAPDQQDPGSTRATDELVR